MATVSDDGWRRPSACSTNSCIEVRGVPGGPVTLRASQGLSEKAHWPTLVVTREEFAAHVAACKAGEYDDLTA